MGVVDVDVRLANKTVGVFTCVQAVCTFFDHNDNSGYLYSANPQISSKHFTFSLILSGCPTWVGLVLRLPILVHDQSFPDFSVIPLLAWL